MTTIGKRIRYLRNAKKLSMSDLGKIIGTDSGNISNWENDKRIPGGKFIIALSSYFEVSADWILTGKEHCSPKDDFASEMFKDLDEKDIDYVRRFAQFVRWSKEREEQSQQDINNNDRKH